jgi:geranylgeranyl diphosphate synthase type 3
MNLHRGQGLDLYWRETYHCPTEEEYMEMVMNSRWRFIFCKKESSADLETGGLFRLAVRLMQSLSPVDVYVKFDFF